MFSRLGNVGSFLLCHWLECLCVQSASLLTPFLCSSAYAGFRAVWLTFRPAIKPWTRSCVSLGASNTSLMRFLLSSVTLTNWSFSFFILFFSFLSDNQLIFLFFISVDTHILPLLFLCVNTLFFFFLLTNTFLCGIVKSVLKRR